LLLVEDNPGDAGLIREMLAEAKGMSFELEWTETLSDGIQRLVSGGIDVVLLDLALPTAQVWKRCGDCAQPRHRRLSWWC